MMIDKIDILAKYYPDKKWSVKNNVITWLDVSSEPTESEIHFLYSGYTGLQYLTQHETGRFSAINSRYPIEKQLEAITDAFLGNVTGLNNLLSGIRQIKLDYPKISGTEESVFYNPLPSGMFIPANANLSVTSATNIGSYSGIFLSKVGSLLQLKSIGVGNNLSITGDDNGLKVEITGNFATNPNLTTTGANLQGQISTVSSNLTTTNTNLTNSGVNLYGYSQSISGNLIQTGVNLQNQLNTHTSNISTLTSNLTSTGANLWNYSSNISENLIATGASLTTSLGFCVTNGANIGGGTGLFNGKTSQSLEFKTLTGAGTVSISTIGNTILLSGSSTIGAGETNTASNAGIGSGLYSTKVGSDLRFKTISGAGTITINELVSDTLVISGSSVGGGGGEANTASNLGVGTGIYSTKVGVDLRFKSLIPGSNITLNSDSDSIYISQPVAGVDKSIHFNAGTVASGSNNLLYDYPSNSLIITGSNPNIQVYKTNSSVSPSSGNLNLFVEESAGRPLLTSREPFELPTHFQSALHEKAIIYILPSTTTTVTAFGCPNTVVGTASTPTIATTNLKTSMRRTLITSAATNPSASEMRSAQGLVLRGNVDKMGGFFYKCRFSINSSTATQRLFVGLMAATGATSTSAAPSSLVNIIGCGWDSADTSLQIMTNDGSGVATKIALGANFPNNSTTAVYELILYAPPNASFVNWQVNRIDSEFTANGSLTTDLPSNTTALTRHEYMNNGSTAAAVALEVMLVYMETSY